jgi:hypothetical protein
MRTFVLVLFLTVAPQYAFASEWHELVRQSTCQAISSDEATLSNADFPWTITLDEAKERGERLYQDGKRLTHRAHLNEKGELVLPYTQAFSSETQPIYLRPHFVKSIRRHIEEALRLGYVDIITFSDMGHNHLYIPWDFYNNEIAPIPASEGKLRYEKMFANPEIKFLYHTAEQFKFYGDDGLLLPDRHIQWRFFTRNLVGDNKGEGRLEMIFNHSSSYNTAHTYEQKTYRYWGAGIYFTANKDGCFPFRVNDEIRYFDINLGGFR